MRKLISLPAIITPGRKEVEDLTVFMLWKMRLKKETKRLAYVMGGENIS